MPTKNRELKRAAQFCLKLADLFSKLSLIKISEVKIYKNSQVRRSETALFFKKSTFIGFFAVLTFSFMKYMDPLPLHLITKKNKISTVRPLLEHMYYYVQPIIFIDVPDVLVPIIDTLPISTLVNSGKEDGEIAQDNYSPSEMFQDL